MEETRKLCKTLKIAEEEEEEEYLLKVVHCGSGLFICNGPVKEWPDRVCMCVNIEKYLLAFLLFIYVCLGGVRWIPGYFGTFSVSTSYYIQCTQTHQ